MTAITVADLDNAKLDCDHIAEVATSLAHTATDRLGHTKKTIAGALYSMTAINPRGAWATATAYAIRDAFTESGTTYVAVLAHTSSTISADLAAGKIAVYQGNLASQVAYDGAGLDVYISSRASRVVDSIAGLRAISKTKYTRAFVTGYYAAGDGGGGNYWYDASDTTSADNGGTVIVAADGGRWKLIISGAVSVKQFGARAGSDVLAVAQANTIAFRKACLSMKSDWNAWKSGLASRSVYVPPGDYNLSNGFTIPKGCSLYADGLGTARLKILGATADVTNILPLVSLGRVIDDATLATEVTTGAYVADPAPQIDNLYLNPQNANTAVDVTNIPGFAMGRLWIQADIAINLGAGTGDGVLDMLVVEDSSGIAVQFGSCQNITIGSLYTFSVNTPVVISGNCQNIDIGILQANYTKVAVVTTNDATTSGRIRIADLVCNNNAQDITFKSVIRTRSASCDISIGNMDARNYNGYAVNNETGLGNVVTIDRLKLRQAPNNPVYTLGTNAKGVLVNNSIVRIGAMDTDGLADSPLLVAGTFPSELSVSGGIAGTHVIGNPVVGITNTNLGSIIRLRGIDNRSGNKLFAAQGFISVDWADIKNPFPIVTESSRVAIHIPFIGNVNTYEVTISANTNSAGNTSYRRSKLLIVGQETSFNGALSTQLTAATLFNSAINTGFTADIAHQVDINTVGGGAAVAQISSGDVVVSVPNTYANVSYSVRKLG